MREPQIFSEEELAFHIALAVKAVPRTVRQALLSRQLDEREVAEDAFGATIAHKLMSANMTVHQAPPINTNA